MLVENNINLNNFGLPYNLVFNLMNSKQKSFLATREQAYVYAISSAALTYTLARACSSGNLHQCTCAGRPSDTNAGNFQWGGCGDNVRYVGINMKIKVKTQ